MDFYFTGGDHPYHLILELYASGNVILTDHQYKILILLRTHKLGQVSLESMNWCLPSGFTDSYPAGVDSSPSSTIHLKPPPSLLV